MQEMRSVLIESPEIKRAFPRQRIVAIGGINMSNNCVRGRGGSGCSAVVSAIVCADDPEQATKNLLAEFERGKREEGIICCFSQSQRPYACRALRLRSSTRGQRHRRRHRRLQRYSLAITIRRTFNSSRPAVGLNDPNAHELVYLDALSGAVLFLQPSSMTIRGNTAAQMT